MLGILFRALLGVGGATAPLDNLDFARGTLASWEGQGFALVGGELGHEYAVTSSDEVSPSRRGMIRYVLQVPPGVTKIRFQAHAAFAPGNAPDHRLDVLLAGVGKRVVPRVVRTSAGWISSTQLLSRWQGKPREYAWEVSMLAGQHLQIVIVDEDSRPGSHVYCTGFHVEKPTAEPTREVHDDFADYMVELQKKHSLAPMARFDSKRFTAYSNASDSFTSLRLRQCEIFYDLFFNHFYQKGFALNHTGQRLMLAVFDSPEGVDAYLGTKLSSGITGMYHPTTNRLLLYDLSENRHLQAQKKKALESAGKITSSVGRTRFVESIERQMDITVQDVNLTTTMHEAAHQISFNCGLLNRQGDVAPWVAEGLATYCEATEAGEWQAIGAPNTARIRDLGRARGKFIPLPALVKDDWRIDRPMLLGYAQSWALFRMLFQERPQAMKAYLQLIHARRTPEYRLADFRQAFGNDVAALENRYFAYLRDLAGKHR